MEGQNPDESFVLAFEQDDYRSDAYFAIVFTPRIINGTHLTRPVEMDETHKLIYEGYAVTVMGQTDGDRRFHTRSVGVSTNGNERVGKFACRR